MDGWGLNNPGELTPWNSKLQKHLPAKGVPHVPRGYHSVKICHHLSPLLLCVSIQSIVLPDNKPWPHPSAPTPREGGAVSWQTAVSNDHPRVKW